MRTRVRNFRVVLLLQRNLTLDTRWEKAARLPMRTAMVMILVATPLTMCFSLGQNRFCYMFVGARGHVFTRV